MTLARIPGRRRGLAAAVAGCALVLSLSACSDDSPSAGDDSSTSSSPSPTEESTAASSEPTEEQSETATGAVADEEFMQVLQTSIDNATTGQVHLRMGVAGQTIKADGAADFGGNPVSMELTMNLPGVTSGPAKMRLVDNVMYLNLGQASQGKYVAFDLDKPGSLPPGMDGLADQMDPLAGFRSFQDALIEATYEGQEDVGGETLDHYVVVADPNKLATTQMAGVQLPKQISYDIWFDQDGLIRRTTLDLPMGAQSTQVRIEIDHWGEPVQVSAPPPAQVIENPTNQSG